ncbi:restriction endonuclease [Nonomuraea sp. NPDC049655]|uniref:restriction endonuclease n=1 Tax=Nonomuraea sp. NPDC049655 TaxID=3364355 RepID=UPI00379F4FD0
MTLLEELLALNGLLAGTISKQERGRRFERWLYKLFDMAGMQSRTAYRPKGEEIDGSLFHLGHRFLLEAKWWTDSVPASSIYQFKGKVDGKLVGTIGLFISMSDYSPDAVDAVRVGKTLNVILFDRRDIEAASRDGFDAVLEFKLRAAVEEGEIFAPYLQESARDVPRELIVLVEGPKDVAIVEAFAERFREYNPDAPPYVALPSMGLGGIARVAAVIASRTEGRIVIVVDSDRGQRDTSDYVTSQLGDVDADLFIVKPGVEAWMGVQSVHEFRNHNTRSIRRLIQQIDMAALARTDPGFRRFAALFGVEFLGHTS